MNNINSDMRISGSFDVSVVEKNSCCDVATRRESIYFDTGDKRKEPKSVQWKKCGQDRTVTVRERMELQQLN